MIASWSKTIKSVLACCPRVLFLPTKQSARPIYSHDNATWKSSIVWGWKWSSQEYIPAWPTVFVLCTPSSETFFPKRKPQHPNPYRKPNCDLYQKKFSRKAMWTFGNCRAPSRISHQILFLPFTKAITQLRNLLLESNFGTSAAGTTRDCKHKGSNADRFNPGHQSPMLFFCSIHLCIVGWTLDGRWWECFIERKDKHRQTE